MDRCTGLQSTVSSLDKTTSLLLSVLLKAIYSHNIEKIPSSASNFTLKRRCSSANSSTGPPRCREDRKSNCENMKLNAN